MDAEEIVKLIKNMAIPDKDILEALREFTTDKYNGKGEIIPMSIDELQIFDNLGLLTRKVRPGVLEKLEHDFLEEHCEHCPACQKMKADQESE